MAALKLLAPISLCLMVLISVAHAQPQHALALYGDPKYPSDFQKFDYVSMNAKKGGTFNNAVVGTFDSLNPFIIRGVAAAGLGLIYETLLENSLDEPQTGYGLLAESVEVPDDRSYVTFKLRPQAKWHDGTPVTADDVVWSFETLLKHGQPFFRSYYAQVKEAKAVDAQTVTFTFKKSGLRELPLVLGSMPILPKAYWTQEGRDFSKTTLDIPMGSGPYRITQVESGRRIVYERIKDWWGADLPIHRGRYNFDMIAYDYYRDPSVAFQAFLGGDADFRQENIAKNWAQGYNHPAVKSGKIIKQEIEHELPAGMQAFAYNLRRPLFQDPLVREALAYAFDYEWSNKQLAFGSYIRTNSFFANSPLAADKPITMEELALLEPYRDQLPPRLFSEIYQPPKTDGSGNARKNLRHAQGLLEKAGWRLDGKTLRNANGKAFEFEILTDSPMFERWLLPFVANLKRLGITVTVREVDTAQYQNRLTDFDYDMTIISIGQSLTPGNEQHAYWSSEMADQPGSSNLMGIENPVVDALVDKIISASTYEELQTATRALDRVLLWNFYVIPQWYVGTFRVAYWDKFGRPSINPPYGLPVTDTWWMK